MKKIRKAVVVLLTLCLLSPCISTVVYAAAAQLQFSDPSTTVGAEIDVKVKLASSASIKTLEASLSYDKEMLRFESGDSATGGDGAVAISGSGTGNELVLMIKFQALKEGTTKISVGSSSGTTASGEALQITNGSSSVTIGAGDPSLIKDQTTQQPAAATGAEIKVDDVSYTITNDFSDAVIPSGFSKTEMTYEGATCQVIKQDSSDEIAMYLTPAGEGDADFFLYNNDKGTFSPFEEVNISEDRYIIMLRDDGTVKLPETYQQTTLTLNGKDFPVWQDAEHSDYYVAYALNSEGQKLLYQYDSVDQTYQRYIKSSSEKSGDTTASKGLWGKITQLLKDHMNIFIIGVWVLLLILLIIIIVVAVKLRHRNLELDDLYEEYGIDEEEPENLISTKGKKGKPEKSDKEMRPAVRKQEKEIFSEDDFDDYDEDLLEEDFEDFKDIDNEEVEEDFAEDDYDEESVPFDDSEIDDLDQMLSDKPRNKKGHMEDDDTFKVDFIDLD